MSGQIFYLAGWNVTLITCVWLFSGVFLKCVLKWHAGRMQIHASCICSIFHICIGCIFLLCNSLCIFKGLLKFPAREKTYSHFLAFLQCVFQMNPQITCHNWVGSIYLAFLYNVFSNHFNQMHCQVSILRCAASSSSTSWRCAPHWAYWSRRPWRCCGWPHSSARGRIGPGTSVRCWWILTGSRD